MVKNVFYFYSHTYVVDVIGDAFNQIVVEPKISEISMAKQFKTDNNWLLELYICILMFKFGIKLWAVIVQKYLQYVNIYLNLTFCCEVILFPHSTAISHHI